MLRNFEFEFDVRRRYDAISSCTSSDGHYWFVGVCGKDDDNARSLELDLFENNQNVIRGYNVGLRKVTSITALQFVPDVFYPPAFSTDGTAQWNSSQRSGVSQGGEGEGAFQPESAGAAFAQHSTGANPILGSSNVICIAIGYAHGGISFLAYHRKSARGLSPTMSALQPTTSALPPTTSVNSTGTTTGGATTRGGTIECVLSFCVKHSTPVTAFSFTGFDEVTDFYYKRKCYENMFVGAKNTGNKISTEKMLLARIFQNCHVYFVQQSQKDDAGNKKKTTDCLDVSTMISPLECAGATGLQWEKPEAQSRKINPLTGVLDYNRVVETDAADKEFEVTSNKSADDPYSYLGRLPFACVNQAVEKGFPVPQHAEFHVDLFQVPEEQTLHVCKFFRTKPATGRSDPALYDLFSIGSAANDGQHGIGRKRSATGRRSQVFDPFAAPRSAIRFDAATLLKNMEIRKNRFIMCGQRPFIGLYDVDSQQKKSDSVGSRFMGYFMSTYTPITGWSGGVSSTVRPKFDPLAQRAPKPAGVCRSLSIFVEVPGVYDVIPQKKLDDSGRVAEAADLSPDGSKIIVADNLGRVALYCTDTLRMLYLWKGYRDATVMAISGSSMLLYASRRGLLEIWNTELKKRVHAYNLGTKFTNYFLKSESQDFHFKNLKTERILISSLEEVKDAATSTVLLIRPKLIVSKTLREQKGGASGFYYLDCLADAEPFPDSEEFDSFEDC